MIISEVETLDEKPRMKPFIPFRRLSTSEDFSAQLVQTLSNLVLEEEKKGHDFATFIRSKKLSFKVANPQKLFNIRQQYGKCLSIDLRNRKSYAECHLEDSVNLPCDELGEEFFTKFNPSVVENKVLTDPEEVRLFKMRKRLVVFIIASTRRADKYLQNFHSLFEVDELLKTAEKEQIYKDLSDVFMLRKAILLASALHDDKVREVYMVVDGFNIFYKYYPLICKFKNFPLYIKPKCSSYPSEIIAKRFYLGNQWHAQDELLIRNLKITHILNVSDVLPNKFPGITYLRINIEDKRETRINLCFPLAFDFMDTCFSRESLKKKPSISIKNIDIECTKFSAVTSNPIDDTNYSPNAEYKIKSEEQISCIATHEDDFELLENSIDSKFREVYPRQNNDHVLLVHCAMGVSRSATMVIMLIMRKLGVPFEQVLKFVKSRREVVDPNPGFIKQLEDWEKNGCAFEKKDGRRSLESKTTMEPGFLEKISMI